MLWNNEAARSDTQIIAINGRSQWVAPKGLKLGLPIAAIEKANGRPFKLSKFGADGGASVLGWEGGALSTLPGGCKVGMRLVADQKAPDGGAQRGQRRQGIALQRRQRARGQADGRRNPDRLLGATRPCALQDVRLTP